MANIKIAQLTNQTAIADTDIILIETATSTNKMTVANLKELLGINNKTDKQSTYTMLYDGNVATGAALAQPISNFKYITILVHYQGAEESGITLPVSFVTSNYARNYRVSTFLTNAYYLSVKAQFTNAQTINLTGENIAGLAGINVHIIGSN